MTHHRQGILDQVQRHEEWSHPTADVPKEVNLSIKDDPNYTKIGVPSTLKLGRSLMHLLKEYVDVFAWYMQIC